MSSVLLPALIALAGPSFPLETTGDCPSAAAVTEALRAAVGADARWGPADPPRVSDLGDRFSVAAAGQAREYADPSRDCDERARAAAVFIALAFSPPPLGAAPPAAAPAAPTFASVTLPAPSPIERWIDLGGAARLDGGQTPTSSLAGGIELRAATGARQWGLAATAGILAPMETTFSSVAVRQQRFPMSLALVRRQRLSERLALATAVGASLVPLTLRAEAASDGRRELRLDVGARVAVELRFAATPRLVPFLGVHAELFPRPYELVVEPLGALGTTGRLWIGVSAGVSVDATVGR